MLQFLVALGLQRLGTDAAYVGEDGLDYLLVHLLETALFGHPLLVEQRILLAVCTRLVDEVDGLVGQEPVVNQRMALLHGIADGLVGESHSVVLLIAALQTLDDADGLVG